MLRKVFQLIRRYYLLGAVAVGILACLFPSSALAGLSADVYAEKGRLDLSDWDFKEKGPVSLSGSWRFYWEMFEPPSRINFQDPSGAWLPVPGPWNRHDTGGKSKGGQGYATLALRVNLGDAPPPLSLYIHEIQTAYRLFINGQQVFQAGQPGISRREMVPEYRPAVIDIDTEVPELDIVIHISNFRHRFGGPWSKIILGPEQTLRRDATYRLTANIFMIGSIFIMGLYHLSLYSLRRKDTSLLYLGVLCCLITVRALVTNERFLHVLLPGIPWEILLKIEYLGFYLTVPAFTLFMGTLFPKEFSPAVLRGLTGAASAFSLAVILLPTRIYSYTVLPYQVLTLAACGYLFHVLYKAARRKRDGVGPIIVGFLALFICALNDILYSNNVIKTGYVLQAGMFIFIFSQAFILSLRFTRAHNKVERQTLALISEIEAKEKLEASLVESHEQFKNSRIALILGLAKLAEYRDTDTGAHLERMREYARMIALDLSQHEAYRAYITPDYIEDIFHSAILHDIGKIGIKDDILLKKGKLTPGEFEVMKTHTLIGGDTITDVASNVRIRSFLTLAKDIAYFHHERWDGTGYPKGLAGKEIPLSARITAIADVYDALTSERPYKPAFSHEKALEIIARNSGSHFDPIVAASFLKLADEIRAVRNRFSRG